MSMAKSIMIQGAGSNVGKSMIVAGICRALTNEGYAVRPFKPQNMSNNAAVTPEGGEIGRAQALQAQACKVPPHTDFNPVLLKPESETGAQVIVNGKRFATVKARDYGALKPQLLDEVRNSFNRLKAQADFVVVEGAGSPAEVNLRAGDIANMGFAQAADVPVVLVGDIDRGGVIAQLVGTHVVLDEADASRIVAFLVNKFRGDASLFSDGARTIADKTGWHDLGVLPWFPDAHKLPAEDILDISSSQSDGITIAVPKLNRIANFDDLDPLKLEPSVDLQIVEPGQPLPGDAKLVILPGSKSTIADLADFRAQGWDVDLHAHIRRGGHVLGICGGYQMLGTSIHDPEGIEGPPSSVRGLGFLDIETTMTKEKNLNLTNATYTDSNVLVEGYEIHIGETNGPDCLNEWLKVPHRNISASDSSGQILGCYMHGLFASDAFRSAFLTSLGSASSVSNFSRLVDDTLDDLAVFITKHIDLETLKSLAR
jgi:adenosylcobyric acid synthase